MSFRYYPSIFNEINNKIRQSTSYVDCKLMFFDGSLVVNFAKLVAAGFWWTRFNNFLKKICNLVAFHLKPRGCLVINNKICEQRQYAIGSCTKNEQGAEFFEKRFSWQKIDVLRPWKKIVVPGTFKPPKMEKCVFFFRK